MDRPRSGNASQTRIDQALALFPTTFQPGELAPDFSDLVVRIDELESQHLVAMLAH